MRLSLAINGVRRTTASLPRAGFLGAHLNLSDPPSEGERSQKVSISGHDMSNEAETVSLEWPTIDLAIGDVVELQVLANGDGDEPSAVSRSSESPRNLLTNQELARDLLQAVTDFDARLMDILERAKALEPEDEYSKLKTAVGDVLMETGERVLYPVYRRHAALIPDALKKKLL